MKGLMRKDTYILLNYKQNALIILVVGLCLAIFQNSGAVMIPSFCMFMSCTYLMGLFTYDDAVDWERYQAALPLGGRKAVASRYAVAYALLGGTCISSYLLALLVLVVKGLGTGLAPEAFATLSAATAILLLVCALVVATLLPLCYKLGVEKVRYVIFIVYGVVVAALVAVALVGGGLLDRAVQNFGAIMVFGLGFAIFALLVAGLVALSYHLSIRIYAAKEF